MSKITVSVFEKTLQKTHVWLKDLAERVGWEDEHWSYLALRAVLHALRDRLSIEVAAKLGAQFPLLIRGIYYESWVPSHTPLKIHHIEDFFNLVAGYLGNDLLIPHTVPITRCVLKVMARHLPKGEIDHLKKVLPQSIAALWTE